MQFPFRDLTNQYISLSYQDVVQRYQPAGTSSFFLDGLGYVLFSIQSNSLGTQFLSVYDTASRAITASYALNGSDGGTSDSASWASASFSSSYASASTFSITSSNLVGWNFTNTSSNVDVLSSNIPVVEVETGSYNSAFFDCVIMSGSNIRVCIVFGAWVDGSINYTEVGNTDIGDTSKVTMSLALNRGNVQLLANVTDTTPWKIKAFGRYL